MGLLPRTGKSWLQTSALLALAIWGATTASSATAWLGLPYSIVMSSHISGMGQSCTGSTPVSLAHDTPCTISVSVNSSGDEVLTVAGGGDTLTTSYKLTGIASGDPDWVDSTSFLARTYFVPGNNITDNMTLWVRGQAPLNRAPEAGDYTATIILTVTF